MTKKEKILVPQISNINDWNEYIVIPMYIFNEMQNVLRMTNNIYHTNNKETAYNRSFSKAYEFANEIKEAEKTPLINQEVPVAGVTDEELEDTILNNASGSWTKGQSTLMADEVDVTELTRDIQKLISKLSVTGNKPLKTEEEIEDLAMKHYPVFDGMKDDWKRKNAFEQSGFITGYKEAQREIFGDITNKSTPIDTLDKEALLKQAKGEAERRNPYEKHMVDWNNGMHEGFIDGAEWVIEEYLRLCTGGGEK